MSYIGNSPGVASSRVTTTITATAAQTVFTTQSGYVLGYVDVYLNGVKLVNGADFEAITGTFITLFAGAVAGDVVELVSYVPRGLSDGYTKSEADAKFLDVGGDSATGGLNLVNVAVSGQLSSTRANSAVSGEGQLYLNGTAGNRIDWNGNGVAAPTTTTRSSGTKLVLYPALGASAVDYGLGIEAGALWSSIPGNDAGQFFKWYGGAAEVASLSGTGKLITIGDATIQGLTVGRGSSAVSTNTAMGTSTLAANTTGDRNTAVGYTALASNTTGFNNAAFGRLALNANTTGNSNAAIGSVAMYFNTTGGSNSALGYAALQTNTTGSGNTGIGTSALGLSTTASNNTAVGNTAAYTNTTGENNVAVGGSALFSNTTGSNNTAVGYQAGYNNTTGLRTVAFGYQALYGNTTGQNNTGIGSYSFITNSIGTRNTGLGDQTGYYQTGSDNTALGFGAMIGTSGLSTGGGNTAVGSYSLFVSSTGNSNTAVGTEALRSNTTASQNTAVGYQTLYNNATGQYNTALGYYALRGNTASGNTALGYYTLANNTTGIENVAVGGSGIASGTLVNNTTGSYNTGLGNGALAANTSASSNTAVGYQAGYNNSTGAGHVYIGYQAGYSGTAAGNPNVAIGYMALYSNSVGTANVAIGRDALYNNTTGNYSVAVGYQALLSNTTGRNVAVGTQALNTNTIGTANTALGDSSLAYTTTGSNNTAVGYLALALNTTANNNTAVGYGALYANTTAVGNTGIGHSAGDSLTTGGFNTMLGYLAGATATTGTYNTFVGVGSGLNMSTGSKNTILGAYDGNQGGLDIRTLNNHVVLSDGDGNPRLFVDGSGRVNIGGISAAAGKLIVDTSGAYYSTDFATALFRESATRSTVRIRTLVDDSAELAFDVNGALRWMWSARPSASSAVGYDLNLYRQAPTPVYTGVSGEIITFQQDGVVLLPLGKLKFPATQNASTNANTLDDYEEGTWTPIPQGSSTAGTYSGTAYGNYVKIGKQVTITAILYVTGFTGAGDFIIAGLPFAAQGDENAFTPQFNANPWSNLLPGSSQIVGLIGNQSPTSIIFRACDTDNTNGTFNQLTCGSTTIEYLRISATYIVS